jgi:hypothetical protein
LRAFPALGAVLPWPGWIACLNAFDRPTSSWAYTGAFGALRFDPTQFDLTQFDPTRFDLTQFDPNEFN